MLDRYARFLVHKSPAMIDAALRSIVCSAYRSVPLFQERLDTVRVSPREIQSQRDLQQLPMASRDNFRDSPTSEYTNRNRDLARCRMSSTSGTTGIPLNVYMNRSEAAYRKLVLFNAIRRNIHLSLPFGIAEVGTGAIGVTARRKSRWFDPVQICHISRTLPIDEQLTRLIQCRPHVITGHPSCLELVAEEVHGCLSTISPRLVVCRGELLRDGTRALLEDSFGCRVVDYYSCDEIGNIAWECPEHQHRLHISTDGCIVEIVDEVGKELPSETEGQIVITNLFNRTMPFIRHRLGDRGSWLGEGDVRCSCGHRGPTLSLLAGRDDDYCLLPNGRKLSPRVLNSILSAAVAAPNREGYYARQYQILQETPQLFRVLIHPRDDAPKDLPMRILKAIEDLDPDISCCVEYVEAIPLSLCGKHRTIIPWQQSGKN